MKIIRLIPLLAVAFLISCAGTEKPVEPENPPAALTEFFEDLKEGLSEIDGVEEIYILSSESAGDFVLGGALPVSNAAYTVESENITSMTEEGPYDELVYFVFNEEEELLQITRVFDPETGDYTATIGEMNIISDRFQTKEGIGVGSTITEFMTAYPAYKIWYTYVSDMYVIETEQLRIQFKLDPNAFEGEIEINGEISGLKAEDFKPDAEIMSIRMYKI